MEIEDLKDAVEHARIGIVISDPTQDDNPIVYVNDGFERLTGYNRKQALGRNCRFLQGDRTADDDRRRLRECIDAEEDVSVRILNYREDGTPFVNELMISPVRDDDGTLTAFFGVQREIEEKANRGTGGGERPSHETGSAAMLREIQHRVKNHLAMVVSLIRMHSSREMTPASYEGLSHRVEALALLYDELLRQSSSGETTELIEIAPYLERVATVIAGIDGRPSIRIRVDCEPMELRVNPAVRLGLLLTELLTNAFNHAFEGRERGSVSVEFRNTGENEICLSVSDDGIGLPEGSNWPHESRTIREQRESARSTPGELDTTSGSNSSGLGGSILRGLTRELGARLEVKSSDRGTRVTIHISAERILPK